MTEIRIVPRSRPEMGRHGAEALLAAAGIHEPVALIMRRGYYGDSMGIAGANDIGLYDDAALLVTPTTFATFNANSDPSRQRPGMATLKPGIYRYKLGIHGLSRPKEKQYEALVQAGPVTVTRYTGPSTPPTEDTGWFGINIHRGGYTTTGSAGCQTIWPDQWEAFIALVKSELLRHQQATLTVLVSDRYA